MSSIQPSDDKSKISQPGPTAEPTATQKPSGGGLLSFFLLILHYLNPVNWKLSWGRTSEVGAKDDKRAKLGKIREILQAFPDNTRKSFGTIWGPKLLKWDMNTLSQFHTQLTSEAIVNPDYYNTLIQQTEPKKAPEMVAKNQLVSDISVLMGYTKSREDELRLGDQAFSPKKAEKDKLSTGFRIQKSLMDNNFDLSSIKAQLEAVQDNLNQLKTTKLKLVTQILFSEANKGKT